MLQDKDRKAYLIQALAALIPFIVLRIIDEVKYRSLTGDNFFFYLLLIWFFSSILQFFAKDPDYRYKWMPWLSIAIVLACIASILAYQPEFTVEEMREKAVAEGFVETEEPPIGTIMWIPDPEEEHDNYRLAYLFEGEKDGEPCYLVANPYFGFLRYDDKEDSLTATVMREYEERQKQKQR